MKNWKLTTECGYHWRIGQMHYWDRWYKPRMLSGDGVAFGPIMFFWNWS